MPPPPCRSVLRARDEDDAYARLTTALKEAPALIRSKPIDLPDLSACLTRDLLTLENRFASEVHTQPPM